MIKILDKLDKKMECKKYNNGVKLDYMPNDFLLDPVNYTYVEGTPFRIK